jgi:oxygen-independent coproporphyrinogen-3 oxidase
MIERPFGLYMHVPFCAQKCPYCDFNTYATPAAPEDAYADALKREVERYASDERFSGRPVSTVFFGGGTPSLLSPQIITRILDGVRANFEVVEGAEVTLEANPSGVSLEKFQGYQSAGVNRISFGVQSFQQGALSLLGRDHTVNEALSAIEVTRQAGFKNISLDLIYGLPGQTLLDLEADLKSAMALPIEHLSAYALTIEQGTPFYQRKERGLLHQASDDLVAQMMDLIPEYLRLRGFERYEISNFAKPGFESRHNSSYWLGDDYLGIGAGAHSLVTTYEGVQRVSAIRWSTLAQPERYMQAAGHDAVVSWRESLDQEALAFEFFYLGLRRTEGVSRARFNEFFGDSIQDRYAEPLSNLKDEGFLEGHGDRIRLTASGIRIADSVFERLILDIR